MNVYAIMNVVTTPHTPFHGTHSINVYAIMNVVTTQRRGNYVNISMNVFCNINALMVQRRRCCSFDSPGLARNEPTLGKHPQGDSTL